MSAAMTDLASLPKRAQNLAELGRRHGWTVELQDPSNVSGVDESAALAFTRPLPSGRTFMFLVVYGRSRRSGRWQALKIEGRYRVSGLLLPGNGSTRDRVADLMGSPLEERLWRTLRSLEQNLAHPERVLGWDWVQDWEGP